jgi:hypothetical protein
LGSQSAIPISSSLEPRHPQLLLDPDVVCYQGWAYILLSPVFGNFDGRMDVESELAQNACCRYPSKEFWALTLNG